MTRLLAILTVLLSSCAQDIAGLKRDERLTLYGTALTLAGKPEFAAIAYGLRRPVTSAKNPLPELRTGEPSLRDGRRQSALLSNQRTGVSALPSKP